MQLRRTKGWRLPAGAIVVARPTRWGNPYRVSSAPGTEPLSRADAVRLFRDDLLRGEARGRAGGVERRPRRVQVTVPEVVAGLRGHDLACWCRLDEPCHAEVLLEVANRARPTALLALRSCAIIDVSPASSGGSSLPSATGEEPTMMVQPEQGALGEMDDPETATQRRSFPALPGAVGAARHFVRRLLDGDERADDAELVVSELATNALRHARSPFTVAVTRNSRLRIEVGDALDELLPSPRPSSPDAADGRGLQIVGAVACAWGARREPAGGKVVWAELGAPPA